MRQNAGQCQGHAVASVSKRLRCLSQIGAVSGTVLNSELGISSLTSSEAHKLPVQELLSSLALPVAQKATDL